MLSGQHDDGFHIMMTLLNIAALNKSANVERGVGVAVLFFWKVLKEKNTVDK